MKQIVYAVEDDRSILDLYRLAFEGSGYDIHLFSRAEDMLKALKEQQPSIIIMDLMLPGIDGIAAVRAVKSHPQYMKIPTIIISAKGDEISKVQGFEAGADDYVAKPFGVLELIARVKANLRRYQPNEAGHILTEGTITLNDKMHVVYVSGVEISLTLKEYSLLKMFMQRKGELITRAELLQEVWGFDFEADTRTLDMHIMGVRAKFAEHTAGKYIHTVRGRGYRFGLEGE
jgi:two-component system alkaline phosphatase synthesis response regulator PhoP